jgi:demethylmenaquinone methyltransferase / 2-methoxy-6-polyprenyl-1,4-benzoquinol methylase
VTQAPPRAAEVAALFDRNAAAYDRVNTVICFGLDRRWRRWAAAKALAPARVGEAAERDASVRVGEPGPPRVLDACGGSGLVALELARRGARVTVADASAGMLALARSRAEHGGLRLDVVQADLSAGAEGGAAAALPGAPFDAITLAFGLRYVDDPAGLLRGLAAALVPGGPLVLLEAVVPRGGLPARLAGRYFFDVAPRVGALLAGSGELYDELTATVRALGSAGDLLRLVESAGLEVRERRLFAGGVVAGVVAGRASGMFFSPARS